MAFWLFRLFSYCPFLQTFITNIKTVAWSAFNILRAEDPTTSREENQDSRISTPMTMNSLPDEILSYIFLLASRHPESPAISQETLLSISHICSRWRQVALSTGQLWAFLVISFPISTEELDRTKAWLHRSDPYPLQLIIDFRDPDWNFDEASHPVQWFAAQATMGVILPEAERWQEVRVFADNWAPLWAFLHYTQSVSTSLLRCIELRRCNPYFAAPDRTFLPSESRSFVPLFGNRDLQDLKVVVLEGVHVDWENAIALRGLTRLSLGYHARDVLPSLAEFRDLLSSCPELESLVIMGWGPRLSRDPSIRATKLQQFRSTIRLPRLKAFELGVMIPSYAIDLLSLFVLPSLESLTLDNITRYDPQTLTSPEFNIIFDYLSGRQIDSSSHSTSISTQFLNSLTVMNLDPGETSFRQFLQSLQELRVLTIQNCSASALEALIPNNSTRFPCKNLRRLFVEALDPRLLINAISARRAHKDSTISLDVVFQQDIDTAAHPILHEIATQFAQLNIQVLPSRPSEDLQWRRFVVDDSEDLVAAILDERWDVPGASMQ